MQLSGHGKAAPSFVRGDRPDTGIYLDATGATVIPSTIAGLARHDAMFGVAAAHTKPVELDFGAILTTELNVVFSMGYPTVIFEVTDDIIKNWGSTP